MHFYQVKVVPSHTKQMNLSNVCARWRAEFLNKKAVSRYSVYRDSEKENVYSVVGEWKTHQAMQKHFQTHNSKCQSAPPGYLVRHSNLT